MKHFAHLPGCPRLMFWDAGDHEAECTCDTETDTMPKPWTRDSYRETESALVGYFSAEFVMAHRASLPNEYLETIARECARQMRWACSEECRGMIAQRETVEQMPTDWVPIAPPDFEL